MKKLNFILFVSLFSIFFGILGVNAKIVKAYDFNNKLKASYSETDPDDLIGFPYMIWGGEGDITLDDSITNYTMYYQWIELSKTQITAIDTARENYDNKVDEVKAKLDELYAKYEAKYQIYKDLVDSGTATTDELQEASDAANAEYKIYDDYYKNAMVEVESYLDAYYKSIPDYKDNWTKADGLHFQGDFSGFSDEREFVLWIQVDYSNKTIYDFAILTVNGTLEDDEDQTDYKNYWDKFVDKFKNTKSLEGMFDLSNNDAFTISNTDSELKIVYKGEDGTTTTTIFTHEKGIVKYIPTEDENAILVDSFLIGHALTALAEMKGYNLEEFLNWCEAQGGSELTLATHGIEFSTEPFNYSESSEGASVNIDTVRYTKFMIDIANGIKYTTSSDPNTEAPKDDTVESPKTGIVTYTVAIVSVALLAGGTYYYLKKKNILKKI